MPLSIDTRVLENRVRDITERKERFQRGLTEVPQGKSRLQNLIQRLKNDAEEAEAQCTRYQNQGWESEYPLLTQIRAALKFCNDNLTQDTEQRQPSVPQQSVTATLSSSPTTS